MVRTHEVIGVVLVRVQYGESPRLVSGVSGLLLRYDSSYVIVWSFASIFHSVGLKFGLKLELLNETARLCVSQKHFRRLSAKRDERPCHRVLK